MSAGRHRFLAMRTANRPATKPPHSSHNPERSCCRRDYVSSKRAASSKVATSSLQIIGRSARRVTCRTGRRLGKSLQIQSIQCASIDAQRCATMQKTDCSDWNESQRWSFGSNELVPMLSYLKRPEGPITEARFDQVVAVGFKFGLDPDIEPMKQVRVCSPPPSLWWSSRPRLRPPSTS